eukprot:g2381.t1
MASAGLFFSVILLHPHGGVVHAQGNGDDDGDNSGSSSSTLPPAGAPSAGDDDASAGYPDCAGYTSHIADGYCDGDLNNASCGWDGGDCCSCTCGQFLESGDELPHPCGQEGGGYDCQDPDVPDDCGVTPSPAAAFGYPDCDGYMYDFQNSNCDDDLNNAACGWDGGDCCYCDCIGAGCGAYGYNCLDPSSLCYGTSSSYGGNEGYSPGVNENARGIAGGEDNVVTSTASTEGSSVSTVSLITMTVFLLCCGGGIAYFCLCPLWKVCNEYSPAALVASRWRGWPPRVPPPPAPAPAQRVRPRPPSPTAAAAATAPPATAPQLGHPSSSVAAAEAAGDWSLAAALRISAASAPPAEDHVERRIPYAVEDHRAGWSETGDVGAARESK